MRSQVGVDAAVHTLPAVLQSVWVVEWPSEHDAATCVAVPVHEAAIGVAVPVHGEAVVTSTAFPLQSVPTVQAAGPGVLTVGE